MHQYGLIGFPLSHSFSKKFFTEKFEREGLTDHVYDLFPIPSIDGLKEVLAANPALRGFNITIPYKRQVLPYLDDASHIPTGISACNCVRISEGRLTGYNTDITGFENSFTPLLQAHHRRALVLGSGGAAEAVTFVLDKIGMEYALVSRDRRPGSRFVYSDLTDSVMREHEMIINTTPLGTYPNVDECPDIPYGSITPRHYLFDLVYNPAKTLFLQQGEAKGAAIRNGYEMLVIQAEESWKIWTGPAV